MQLALGLLVALFISGLAYLTRNLTRDGALAAIVLGTAVFGIGGWQWAAILVVFFAGSSILSRFPAKQVTAADEKYAKGSRRDAGQVMGNGAAAALFVMLQCFLPGSSIPFLGFAGAVAAVNADTWATELGVLNHTPPRLITNLRRVVPQGTSGGISAAGTVATALGSGLIAALSALLGGAQPALWFWFVLAGGIFGAVFDSLLGATVQSMYRCTRDGAETEQHPLHRCGAPTAHTRGWPWLNNDWVNFGCGLFGGLVACALQLIAGAL